MLNCRLTCGKRFKQVMLSGEFPYCGDLGGNDAGIDLVVLTHKGFSSRLFIIPTVENCASRFLKSASFDRARYISGDVETRGWLPVLAVSE